MSVQKSNSTKFIGGDSYEHSGVGDIKVSKIPAERRSYWKEILITVVGGILIAIFIWYFRLNDVRPV